MLKQLLNKFIFPKDKPKSPEQTYFNILESMEEGFASCRIIYDKTGKPLDFFYLHVNPAFAGLVGLPIERIRGKTGKEIIPKMELFWIEAFSQVVQSGKSEHFENSLVPNEKQFEVRIWPTGGNCFAAIFSNITTKKKIEAELFSNNRSLEQQSKEQRDTNQAMLNVMEDLEEAKTVIEIERAKAEAMLVSIGEGLIAVDNKRKVSLINKTAENMIGWKKKDFLGKDLTRLPLEDESGNCIPLNKRPTTIALATGEKTKVTYFFVRPDKTRFPIMITATPIKLSGKTIGLIEIIRDITRELEIDRAKSEFVSLASHQLRTPLGIIKWYLEALENEDYIKKAPQEILNYFFEICKSNERVLSLVRDLLSVSRIDEGRVKNTPKIVKAASVLRESVEQMQVLAGKREVLLHLSIENKKIPLIKIDTLRFHEVVENLIANAIQYSKSYGRVDVSLKSSGNTLLINVADTGIGISIADQKKIFTKFFRSEKAVAYNPEGSGLGLYVVKSYVKGWGGKISVKSVEGKGSTFTISLPISQKKVAQGGR